MAVAADAPSPQRRPDAVEVNVAPHNFDGYLGSLVSAQCAAIPDFRVMATDIDDLHWSDVNEEFVRAHPP